MYLVGRMKTYDKNGVHIVGVGEMPGSRLKRMIEGARCVYKKALALDCNIYHFHDPELLPYGLKLKRKGKKVIFDSHEDVPAQIMDKEWIPRILRKAVAKVYKAYETHAVKQLDAVVAATPHIAEQFEGRAKRVVIINNYPKLDDIEFHTTPFSEREPIVCYAGGISEIRGEKVMVEAMKDVDGMLILAGEHEKMEITGQTGVIRYLGQLERAGVNALYGQAVVGLCILKPICNYFYSQPIKIYEYMAAGIPFICSDFPGWRKLAEDSGAGICVGFDEPERIASVVRKLLSNRGHAQEMGRRGHDYVVSNCSWTIEESKLLFLYGTM
ncbi:MAG: glycosyltransferase [Clostridiales bacterium]|nr:glycosyltransferase [Clostridiales bacterium]